MLIGFERVGSRAVVPRAAAKLVLLGDQAFDSCRDVSSLIDRILVRGYDRHVARADAFVDEVANELATWPGVHIERREDDAALVLYEQSELGVLYPGRGLAELPFVGAEHDQLVEHGDAEPAKFALDSPGVSHDLRGPGDVTDVLELFDRRYRDVRGEGDVYSSEDPDYPHGRLDQL